MAHATPIWLHLRSTQCLSAIPQGNVVWKHAFEQYKNGEWLIVVFEGIVMLCVVQYYSSRGVFRTAFLMLFVASRSIWCLYFLSILKNKFNFYKHFWQYILISLYHICDNTYANICVCRSHYMDPDLHVKCIWGNIWISTVCFFVVVNKTNMKII